LLMVKNVARQKRNSMFSDWVIAHTKKLWVLFGE